MKVEQEVLFKLIRIALGNESCGSLPLSVDWKKVIDLSFEQGVAAIAVDGLQRLYDKIADQVRNDEGRHAEFDSASSALEALDSPALEDLKYEWFGEVMNSETSYAEHEEVLRRLVSKIRGIGAKTLLLKGLGLSKYYPIPNHRPTGDIDIYTYGHQEEVDALMAAEGIEVNMTYEKHSTFSYRGVTIENHYIYLDSFLTKCERRVQKYLEGMTDDVLNEDGYYTPSPLKNYIFLLCHKARHFSQAECIKLRHLLDWGLFLKEEAKNLDKDAVAAKLREFGLVKTNDLFVGLAQKACGLDFSEFIIEGLPEQDIDMVVSYILEDKTRNVPDKFLKRIGFKVKALLESRWKYKYLAITLREWIWYSFKVHLQGKEEI